MKCQVIFFSEKGGDVLTFATSVDSVETVRYEPSHLDQSCLQSLLLSPVAPKELMYVGSFSEALTKFENLSP